MSWKHILSIVLPYAIAGAAGIAAFAAKSPSPYVAAGGGLILAFFAHKNLYTSPPGDNK